MPNTTKTAVSIPHALAERADGLAQRLQVSRSRLFALALEEYVRKYENATLLEQVNAAYADEPDAEERERLERSLAAYREVIDS